MTRGLDPEQVAITNAIAAASATVLEHAAALYDHPFVGDAADALGACVAIARRCKSPDSPYLVLFAALAASLLDETSGYARDQPS
jgi:hypothetical protein